jgi:hypothetical protein
MVVRSTICALVAIAIILVTQSDLHAKKGAAAKAAATTTATSQEIDPKTGKARAQTFEKGKPVDTAKTKGQIGRISTSTGNLADALRGKSTKTTTPPPPTGKKHKVAVSQPASQPAKTVKAPPPQEE